MSEQADNTIELPVDANGVPIRLKDVVWTLDSRAKMRVDKIMLYSDQSGYACSQWLVSIIGYRNPSHGYTTSPANLSHEAPDSMGRIKNDTYDLVMAEFIEDPEGEVEKIFERISRLLHE